MTMIIVGDFIEGLLGVGVFFKFFINVIIVITVVVKWFVRSYIVC